MEQWLLNTAGPGGIVIVGVILVLREVRRHQPDVLGKLDNISQRLGGMQNEIEAVSSELEAVSSRLEDHIRESRMIHGRKQDSRTAS